MGTSVRPWAEADYVYYGNGTATEQTPELALAQLRSKVETKLGYTLEEGWFVAWEEVSGGSAGGVRREKVFYDPVTPGVKLYGDSMALVHVKARLAAAAAEAAAAAATVDKERRAEAVAAVAAAEEAETAAAAATATAKVDEQRRESEFKTRLAAEVKSAVGRAVEEERRKAKAALDAKEQKAAKVGPCNLNIFVRLRFQI
jgi:hypothetical protein